MLDHPIARFENLKVEFQTQDGPVEAVKGVSFDIAAGETVVASALHATLHKNSPTRPRRRPVGGAVQQATQRDYAGNSSRGHRHVLPARMV